ncbi:MAG: FAD-binding oxidoreductase [Leptospirales bacterium]|nr:FAD-binding oxidoreductase [Leptospirales bacterium]
MGIKQGWKAKAAANVLRGIKKAVSNAGPLTRNLRAMREARAVPSPAKPTPIASRGGRYTPEQISIEPLENESLDVWGFKDTSFIINERGHVELSGTRYELSGQDLPRLLPWINRTLGHTIDGKDIKASHYPTFIAEPQLNEPFMQDIRSVLNADQIVLDGPIRLRHGHGHTQEEMYLIKYGRMTRIPDAVVFPTEEAHVTKIVEAAQKHNVCIIPFGGGTNVTDALRCPENETRMIVSVDMRKMNRILWIDPVNRMACIEAGAVGRHITESLSKHGFTMGHEPDSMEFSTLGGWIATHASGMKKNKYGNIEGIVLDVRVVTASGILSRPSALPRESIGIDPKLWLLGSEGTLGIVTSAIVKLFPLPPERHYGSVVFSEFENGVEFMYELAQQSVRPASVRLMDNVQFQLGQALKPAAEETQWEIRKAKLQKFFVTTVKGFDPDRMVACTLVFEGTQEEVAAQEQMVYAIARKHGGLKGGSENGQRGYQLTFGIAYIRDFMMNHHLIAESFETSVPWSNVVKLCSNVKRRINEEHAKRNLPGRPVVTCRVTQIYDTGACIYFYFAFYGKGVENPSDVFKDIEHAAREEILRSGGSLSHHHGIGKHRRDFIPEIMSEAMVDWKRRQKAALDPMNIFGTRNGLPDTGIEPPDLRIAAAHYPQNNASPSPKPGFWARIVAFFKRIFAKRGQA